MFRMGTLLLILLTVVAPAQAQSRLVDARTLARELHLAYEDIGNGALPSAKLSGNGHEILIFADMRNIVVDGRTALLAHPVQWNGASLMIPPEGADLIRERLGLRASRPEIATATSSIPDRKGPFHVVLDPGHGGDEPGAIGARIGVKEKDVNLDVALRLGKLLTAKGVKVTYTRTSDVAVSLDDRAEIANRLQPDLFVSIHANADKRASLRGAMTLYPHDGPPDGRSGIMGRARANASSVTADELGAGGEINRNVRLPAVSAAFEGNRVLSIQASRCIQNALEPVTGLFSRDRGVIEDPRGVRVLRNVRVPAVLVEVDFLSNIYSERKLARSSYRAAIAQAVSRGIIAFLENLPE